MTTDDDSLKQVTPKLTMNAFQQECSQAIERVLSEREADAAFVNHASVQPPEDGAALFLRADLVHAGRHYKLYVYPDGAGAGVGGNWYVLESQNYETPQLLIQTFCKFLEGCLDGLHPLDALAEARAPAPGTQRAPGSS